MNVYAPENEQGGPEIAVARYEWGKAEKCRRGQSSRSIIQNRGSAVTEMPKR